MTKKKDIEKIFILNKYLLEEKEVKELIDRSYLQAKTIEMLIKENEKLKAVLSILINVPKRKGKK